MKKFIFSLLTFILLGITLGGGVFLLAGCDYSQSQEENNQEDRENETDNNEEINDDIENDNSESGDNLNNNDENDEVEESRTSFEFKVRTLVRHSDSNYFIAQNIVNEEIGMVGYFDFVWYDENYNYANLTADSKEYVPAVGRDIIQTGGEKGTSITRNVKYMYYKFSSNTNYRRFGGIIGYETHENYVWCGVASSTSNSLCRTSQAYYSMIYGASSVTTKVSTAQNNCSTTLNGNFYVVFRLKLKSTFDCNGGKFSNGQTNTTKNYLAGVSFTLPEAPTRTGYTFGGWLENNGTRASAGQVYPDNWADSSKSFTAQWIPLSYKISYNSNGAGTYNPHTVIYGDSYGGDNLYNPSNNVGLSNGMTLSNNIFNVKYTNNGNSTYYMNFFQPYDVQLLKPGETYTFVVEVMNKSSPGTTGIVLSSPYDVTDATDVTTNNISFVVSSNGVYSKTFTARSLWNEGNVTLYNFRSFVYVDAYQSANFSFRISLFAGDDVSLNNFSYATYGSRPSSNVLPTPTKAGYTFNGWYTSSNGGTQVTSSTIVSQTSSHTLYAHWTVNTYTNRYNFRTTTGSSTTSTTQTRTYGQSFTTYTTSSIAEYNSNGWSLYGWATSSSSASRSYSPGESVSAYNSSTSTLNFYAVSSRTISLTYNANGGTNAPSSTSATQLWNQNGNVYNTTGLTITSSVPKRDGYTFLGWATSSTAASVRYKSGDTYSFTYSTANSDILYAVWEANTYYVKFNGNGSTSGSMSNQTFTYDKAQNLTVNAFARTGYTFAGWATSANGTVAYVDKASVKNLTTTNGATVNLYAKWNVVTYTITYNGNGGSSPSSLSYNIESTSTLASSTRTGYTFNTWKPERTSGNWSNASTYNSGTSVSGMYGDVTLVAQWTAYNYTVIFNKNSSNATGTMSNQTFTYDVSQNLTANAFENDGYSFVGWATSPTGNVIYSNGDSVSNLTSTNNGMVTLYAKWVANLEAKYDTAGGYYYVEIGNMPQTKVTDSSLISQLNSSTTNGATYYINGTTMVGKVVIYNNQTIEACKYENNWYKVEPIRWRLAYSSLQTSGYGTTTDTFAVLDTIVYAGQYSATEIGLNSGYVTTTLDEFKKNVTSTTYLATFSANVESFSPTGTTSKSQSANMFISSADEISSVLNNKTGLSKYSVKFSDLVSDILGNGIKQYYTRNLGSNTSTIKSYTELGMPTQNLCTNIQGVQFTIKVSEYGCV